MKRRFPFVWLNWVLLVGWLLPACHKEATSRAPAPARMGASAEGALTLSEEDRCPVCAMQVVAHPQFACGIALDDGVTYHFCGTGCMMRAWLHPEVYLGVPASRVKRPLVQDHLGGKPLDARQAIWIAGSDVQGPMGPALVPVASQQDAKTFAARHGSQRVFGWEQLNDAFFQELTGKPAVKPSP